VNTRNRSAPLFVSQALDESRLAPLIVADRADLRRNPPRPCEKAMFKSLCGSGSEARLGLLAVLIFVRRGAQAALIAWMSGYTPRMAIIRFRL
jgi:hypothetical protein